MGPQKTRLCPCKKKERVQGISLCKAGKGHERAELEDRDTQARKRTMSQIS